MKKDRPARLFLLIGLFLIREDDFVWVETQHSADPESCLHGTFGQGLFAVFETLILPDMHPQLYSYFLLRQSKLGPAAFQNL